MSITSITFLWSGLPPIASLTLSITTACSLYIQQRIVGVLPGIIILGILGMFSVRVPCQAKRATSLNTLYLSFCTLVSNILIVNAPCNAKNSNKI